MNVCNVFWPQNVKYYHFVTLTAAGAAGAAGAAVSAGAAGA